MSAIGRRMRFPPVSKVRSGRIRCFAWEYAEEYLSDFLNLFRAPGESSSGQGTEATTFIYRSHPSKPNDTLMAVNYAFLIGRVSCLRVGIDRKKEQPRPFCEKSVPRLLVAKI